MKKRFLLLLAFVVVSLVPAQVLNILIEKRVQAFVAQDHNSLQLPLTFETIAVRSKPRWNRSGTSCEGFCLSALLTGVAQRMLIVKLEGPDDPVATDVEAVAYYMENRAVCPKVTFVPGHHLLKLPQDKWDLQKQQNPRVAMEMSISTGRCLISEPATLGEAEVVLTHGNVVHGPRYPSRLGFSLTTKTETVDRLAVHVANPEKDGFTETYRWTGVQYMPFVFALIPAPGWGYGFEVNMAWMRLEKRINIESRFYERPDWAGFLTDTLRLDLSLETSDVRGEFRTKIEKVIENGVPPSVQDWEMIETYFDAALGMDHHQVWREDGEIALALLKDQNFPTIPQAYRYLEFVVAEGMARDVDAVAEIYWERLERGQTWSPALSVSVSKDVRRLQFGLSQLPDYAFLNQFDRLKRLARNPVIHAEGRTLIRRIGDFEERAVPLFMDMIETSVARPKWDDQSKNGVLAGLSGLCATGSAARGALPRLQELFEAGRLRFMLPHLLTALVRLNADTELLWRVYQGQKTDPSREKFERKVVQMQARVGCAF